MDIINGQLARSIQGATDNGVIISDYYSTYNETEAVDDYFIDISRTSYRTSR